MCKSSCMRQKKELSCLDENCIKGLIPLDEPYELTLVVSPLVLFALEHPNKLVPFPLYNFNPSEIAPFGTYTTKPFITNRKIDITFETQHGNIIVVGCRKRFKIWMHVYRSDPISAYCALTSRVGVIAVAYLNSRSGKENSFIYKLLLLCLLGLVVMMSPVWGI
jgi:hypothetical protein